MYTTLISVDQLQTLRASGQPLMVFDCSFELMQPDAGDAQYLAGHIPGALRADLDRHLSAKGAPDAASGGRHPLPSRPALAAWLGSVGLTPEHQVVVYDRQGVNYCGRLWWMLKWLGHDAVAVLDGGLSAWTAAGGAMEAGTGPAQPSATYVPGLEKAGLVDAEAVAKQLGTPAQTLIDARGAPRFRGDIEPLDPVAATSPARSTDRSP